MKKWVLALISIFLLIFLLFLLRAISSTEIDDVHPEIPCPEIEKYNPDVLYVIPEYKGISISENKTWCENILSLNKTLELHGITHEYREFLHENISQEELNFVIVEFQKCFNEMPQKFKPPQLKINSENKEFIKSNGLKIRNAYHEITHKVYHCNDSGKIPNKVIRIF